MSEDGYVSSCSSLCVHQHQQVLWDLSMMSASKLNQKECHVHNSMWLVVYPSTFTSCQEGKLAEYCYP